jgi:hypothetical protein
LHASPPRAAAWLPAAPVSFCFASCVGSQWLLRCSRAKRSVAAGWAKLRAAAALASASAPVEQDGFSRLPSGFQRVSFLARHCIQPWLLLCHAWCLFSGRARLCSPMSDFACLSGANPGHVTQHCA